MQFELARHRFFLDEGLCGDHRFENITVQSPSMREGQVLRVPGYVRTDDPVSELGTTAAESISVDTTISSASAPPPQDEPQKGYSTFPEYVGRGGYVEVLPSGAPDERRFERGAMSLC